MLESTPPDSKGFSNPTMSKHMPVSHRPSSQSQLSRTNQMDSSMDLPLDTIRGYSFANRAKPQEQSENIYTNVNYEQTAPVKQVFGRETPPLSTDPRREPRAQPRSQAHELVEEPFQFVESPPNMPEAGAYAHDASVPHAAAYYPQAAVYTPTEGYQPAASDIYYGKQQHLAPIREQSGSSFMAAGKSGSSASDKPGLLTRVGPSADLYHPPPPLFGSSSGRQCPTCPRVFSDKDPEKIFVEHVLECADTVEDSDPGPISVSKNYPGPVGSLPESAGRFRGPAGNLTGTAGRISKPEEDRECPVCAARFDKAIPQREFEEHVNNHFMDEDIRSGGYVTVNPQT